MIPPYAQRGQPIPPSSFNALIDMVKSAQLTSVVGGTFSRSIGGTALTITSQSTGSGGGATQGLVCQYFEVTDASEGEVLKVEVAQNQIAGRWPEGMGIGNPPFILELSGSSYIYAAIYWDTVNLVIGPDADAITILQSNDLLANTSDMQYILLATVTVGGDPAAITQIDNVCTQPVPNPCLLDWSTPAP
jgi:hypothetical protein